MLKNFSGVLTARERSRHYIFANIDEINLNAYTLIDRTHTGIKLFAYDKFFTDRVST